MKTIICVIYFILPFFVLIPSKKDQQTYPTFDKGVWVIQYNASFNKCNDFKWVSRPGINYHYVDLDARPEFKRLAKIDNSVPTIVVYKNGIEVKRFEPGISFKLDINQSQILKSIK
jgi:hypothetical protein